MTEQPRRLWVSRHRTELGGWESVFAEPDPRLRPYVRGRYQGWVEDTRRPVRRREVPVIMVPMILNLGPAWLLNGAGNPSGPAERFNSFTAGLHDTFVLTRSTGRSRCLQVDLTPLGAFRVFGLAMCDIANRIVTLDEVFGTEGWRLTARLRDAATWEARFALVDAFLAARLSEAPAPAPEVAWALGALERSRGGVSIGALTEAIGCSRKRLIARFRDQLGLTPKTVARILRFTYMVDRLAAEDGSGWAELAYDAGYYDQAHFNRDFRAFTGCAPRAYLRERMVA